MIIYLIVFLISILLIHFAEICKVRKEIKFFLILISLLLPSLLAGLRSYEIGSDTTGYGLYWFNQAIRFNDWISFVKYAKGYSIDYGYASLLFIASRIGQDAHIFFFILSFLELSGLYVIVKRNCPREVISFSFFVYFLLYFNDSLNNMRQFPAVLIVLYSYRFIKEKKLISFLLSVILATFFHITAFFALLLYPVAWMARNRFSKLNLLLITAIVLIACFSFEQIFNIINQFGINLDRYEHYIYNAESGGKFIRLFLFGSIWIIFLFNKKKYEKYISNEADIFLFYSTISVAFTSLMFLGITNYIIRLSYYFDFFVLIYLPSIIKFDKMKMTRDGKIKGGTSFIIVVALLLFYWFITYVIRNGAQTVPYKFYWN